MARVKTPMAPGTVVIVLSGEHAGARAIVLSESTDGYYVVYGPLCSLLRIPRRHCQVTSTSLDVSGVPCNDLTQDLFKDGDALATRSAELEAKIGGLIKADNLVEEYLNTRFSLNDCLGVPPHELKF